MSLLGTLTHVADLDPYFWVETVASGTLHRTTPDGNVLVLQVGAPRPAHGLSWGWGGTTFNDHALTQHLLRRAHAQDWTISLTLHPGDEPTYEGRVERDSEYGLWAGEWGPRDPRVHSHDPTAALAGAYLAALCADAAQEPPEGRHRVLPPEYTHPGARAATRAALARHEATVQATLRGHPTLSTDSDWSLRVLTDRLLHVIAEPEGA